MDIVIKSQETKEGVKFRILRDNKYLFADLPFQNYFYVKTSDFIHEESEFIQAFTWCVEDTKVVGQFTKIVLSSNWMRVRVRTYWEARNISTYEADIKANKRFLLDKSPPLHNEHIPYLFYDIETDDRLPLQKDERGDVLVHESARIISFCAVDQDGKQYSECLEDDNDESEKALLGRIMEIFSQYGIISGWYSSKFDKPYIEQRCKFMGINCSIFDYINHIDYKELYTKYDKKSLKSYSLNNVSNIELGESKLDQAKGNGAIYNSWADKSTKAHLLAYNLEDANLIYKMNKKLMFIEVSMKRANNAGCHVQATMHNSMSGDYLLMREYSKEGIIMPSQPTKEQLERRYEQGHIGGGYTTCFKPGLHDKIDVWDFKSEYPSVIQSFNISPETYVETLHKEEDALALDKEKYIVTPADFEGVYHPHRVYRRDKEGIIPRVVRVLVETRDKIKYTMSEFKDTDPDKYRQLFLENYAYKTDGNSIYGILAFPKSRYYSWELGDSVTTSARATLKQCNDWLKDLGCSVVGGDTDSTFVDTKEKTVKEVDDMFVENLDLWAKKWNCIVNKLVFEYEKTWAPFFFVMKKNYAALENGKMIIKGMAAIKSDANYVAAKMQHDFIEDILYKKYDEEEWRLKIDNIYSRVFNQDLTSEELVMVKALTKMPLDYEGNVIDSKTGKAKVKADGTIQVKAIPAHVKLAERMLAKGIDLMPGSKIKFIVIKDKPILALSPEEFALKTGIFKTKTKKHGYVDYEFAGEYDAKYYWVRILKPLVKVLSVYHGRLPEWNWNLTNSVLNKMLVAVEE